jgi:hypothetical protein
MYNARKTSILRIYFKALLILLLYIYDFIQINYLIVLKLKTGIS